MRCTSAPHLQFLKKIGFSALSLAKISALKTQNFRIFAPKTPNFSRKSRSLDPTFGNLRQIPTKKKLSAPPRDKTVKVSSSTNIALITNIHNYLQFHIWYWYINEIKIHIKYIHCHKFETKLLLTARTIWENAEKSQSSFTWWSMETKEGNVMLMHPSP